MQYFPAALQELADQFARLPGIGGKTAQRLAFHVLEMDPEDAQSFADAIIEAKKSVHCCPVCQNLTDREICPICDDMGRDKGLVCVVAEPKDVIAMERAREFSGVYHVLHGVISPMNGVGPDNIRIKELIQREPLPAPKFWLNPEVKDFYQFTRDDVRLDDYITGPQVTGIPVAI